MYVWHICLYSIIGAISIHAVVSNRDSMHVCHIGVYGTHIYMYLKMQNTVFDFRCAALIPKLGS